MDKAAIKLLPELTPAEEKQLLQVARAALETAVQTGPIDETWLPPMAFSQRLLEAGASFVTLHVDGALRGCVGSAQAHRPLVEDVSYNATCAALADPRFEPVTEGELPRVKIEISILTPLLLLEPREDVELAAQIRPRIDGVMITCGPHRALLLPQNWDRLPDPPTFMAVLCRKAGLHEDTWLEGDLEVYTFQCHVVCEGE